MAPVLFHTVVAAARVSKPKMAFDKKNPAAITWAERRAAELVTDITRKSRETIRMLIADGLESGIAPRDTARLIRDTIGLTERDAGAVVTRHRDMLSKGIKPDEAARRSERYAAKLLRSRSETIARTETMRASNEGQKQLWDQAREKGLLTGEEKKVWMTADPCPICADLEGQTVPLSEDFSIGGPPAHPNCRCTTGLVWEK